MLPQLLALRFFLLFWNSKFSQGYIDTYEKALALQKVIDGSKVNNALYATEEDIKVQFFLHNSFTNSTTVEVSNSDVKLSEEFIKRFDRTSNTTIVCHGFLQNVNFDWMKEIKTALLEMSNDSLNVILVNWPSGEDIKDYYPALYRTQTVGIMAAKLVMKMQEHFGYELVNVHFIGFSLGGEIAGYFGEEIAFRTRQRVARITGLDPASPGFSDDHPSRLSKVLADHVDIIHTSAGGDVVLGRFGITAAVGTVDYYPNGGRYQPACAENSFGCSHDMACTFFINSIRKCRNKPYLSRRCDVIVSYYSHDKCMSENISGPEGLMGMHSVFTKAEGPQYLTTEHGEPYCSADFKEDPFLTILRTVAVSATVAGGIIIYLLCVVYFRWKKPQPRNTSDEESSDSTSITNILPAGEDGQHEESTSRVPLTVPV